MKPNHKTILIGLLLIAGIAAFLSGEFIIASVLFGIAAVASNTHGVEFKNGENGEKHHGLQ